MKRMTFFITICAALLCVGAATARADAVSPETAAQNPGHLKALLLGQGPQAAAGIVTDTVKAAIELGGAADAVKERLALIAAAAINSAEPNAREAVARALVSAAGPDSADAVVAAITLAAGTASWAGDVVKAAVAAAGDSETAQQASKQPVDTLGEDLARRVVALSARLKQLQAVQVEPEAAEGDADDLTVPPRAEKYRGQ